jgi:hypothetical protein
MPNATAIGTQLLKMRRTGLSELTRRVLWALAAGRCEYSGCNKLLIGDLISGAEDRNFGFVAHIVAETPKGPRGDSVRSPLLADDVRNLLLLCHVHHKLIDVDDVVSHPEARLLAMKSAHEARIEILTAVDDDRASHVLRFGADIGTHESAVAYEHISRAMLPDRYPAEGRRTIDIELHGMDHRDHETEFWNLQVVALRRQFERKVRPRLEAKEIRHLSIFALAPQPLLMELGRLLGDIAAASVYQFHREPPGWGWSSTGRPIEFKIRRSSSGAGAVALILALSATISDVRVVNVLGPNTRIWGIEGAEPHNDLMRRPEDLAEFRRLLRSTLNDIKATHGEDTHVHVFPALPVSAAVEVGRVWMPKADLPLRVYDQNRRLGGFTEALSIESV